MSAPLTVDWAAARRAVADAGPRLTWMLRTIRKPDAPALGEWDITGVATHISHAVATITAMSKGGGGNIIEHIDGLEILTRTLVAGEGRLPLGEVADRIDAGVAAFLAAMEAAAAPGGEGDTSHPWLVQGIEAPLSVLTCHMLNELTVHGRDIAKAEGVPWPIDRGHATLILRGFVLTSLHYIGPGLVVQEKAGDKHTRFEIHLRGDGRVCMVFDGGTFSVEETPQGKVDCHLSVDPTAFLLVAWARISQWSAIPKGQLFAFGRKPWLGLQLRSWLRNP